MERTLVIFKPGALQRGIVGEVLSRFEKRGLRIVALKMTKLSSEQCRKHYSHLVNKSFYPIIEESMMASPVILCCLEGIDAIEVVRTMAGSTNGRAASPGTIRGDYCMSHQENIIHTSDSLESANAELEHFFKESDYCDYDSALIGYLYAKDEL